MSSPESAATTTNTYPRLPLPPSLRMFKNAARSLRFANGTDDGRRIGVMRAIELMPGIRQMKTDQELFKLAATTLKKLEGYRTGWGLSQVKARDRIIALGQWRLHFRDRVHPPCTADSAVSESEPCPLEPS